MISERSRSPESRVSISLGNCEKKEKRLDLSKRKEAGQGIERNLEIERRLTW